MKRRILLVNPNLMKPPIAPLGLEYIAGCLVKADYDVDLLDLTWVDDDPLSFIDSSPLLKKDYLFVGVSIRNIDDSYFASSDFCLDRTRQVIDAVRSGLIRHHGTSPSFILGGIGYSIFPSAVLYFCNADYGLVGDTEIPLVQLAEYLAGSPSAVDIADISGLIRCDPVTNTFVVQPPHYLSQSYRVCPGGLCDTRRYYQEGGMLGFETKRGCPRQCVYCPEPLVLGRTVRYRHPSDIADELEMQLEKGISHFHTCDSEFNISREHVLALCQEISRRNLGKKIKWYAYCVPTPFDKEMASSMREAGCCGIDFTVDSLVPERLGYYNHLHTPEDVKRGVALCREYGISTMLDMLLGAPGETRESILQTLERGAHIDPDCVGISLGVRLYPGTEIWKRVKTEQDPSLNPSIHGYPKDPESLDEYNLLRPVFYLEHTLGEDCADFVMDRIRGDKRFMFGGGSSKEAIDYNYNQNQRLRDALRGGKKGAYWHILNTMS